MEGPIRFPLAGSVVRDRAETFRISPPNTDMRKVGPGAYRVLRRPKKRCRQAVLARRLPIPGWYAADQMGKVELTYRMFIQEGDQISLHPKTKNGVFVVFREPFIPRALAKDFEAYVGRIWTTYTTQPVFEIGEKEVTMQEICDTVIHGIRAHLDRDKHDVYESWTSAFGAEELTQAKFRVSLYAMISNIIELQKIVVATLDKLRA